MTTVFNTEASAAELTPSSRAWSWSMRTRTIRAGSIQSKFTRLASGSLATTPASCMAMSRTSLVSGPLTRYCTGQPTGGPSPSGETRDTAPGNCSASSFSSFTSSRWRAATSLAISTVWVKKSFASSTGRGR